MECSYFKRGTCKFGANCRYKHVISTDLFNPPRWILSSYTDQDLSISEDTFSFEEVRVGFYLAHQQGPAALGGFFNTWNSLVVSGYNRLVGEIEKIAAVSNAIEGSPERTVDIRDPGNHHLLIQPITAQYNLEAICSTPIAHPSPAHPPQSFGLGQGQYAPTTAPSLPPSLHPQSTADKSPEHFQLGEIPTEPPTY
ncbi:hypothetical protein NEDG_01900 [Nematocida displodere]|uniref:C3H1-type domain-containing protein n=1 Tax=Nematocida displodere TaxID=1805483 RepID=A0A177EHE3_9MICR|nr:hypothetical protein NEDG_01900 [Nematocida displodere]